MKNINTGEVLQNGDHGCIRFLRLESFLNFAGIVMHTLMKCHIVSSLFAKVLIYFVWNVGFDS